VQQVGNRNAKAKKIRHKANAKGWTRFTNPRNGLFRFILYPHYLCEWIEWCGSSIIGGYGCVPVRSFVLNDIAIMTPRALKGWRWYVHRLGKETVGVRKTMLPGILKK
jgi:3-oxo-5-alpha-steroid 4-dehydrogenase 1